MAVLLTVPSILSFSAAMLSSVCPSQQSTPVDMNTIFDKKVLFAGTDDDDVICGTRSGLTSRDVAESPDGIERLEAHGRGL
jgi:hypothetical protein